MADELNIPTHRWYQKRNHIALAKEDFSRQYIYDSGIQKIDAWINSQPWGNPIPPLFANDEQGAWYDPSDLDTLFQDTAGTTPVTTAGQTVGLMLDKSGNDLDATQPTAAARPSYIVDADGTFIQHDLIDDALTVTLPDMGTEATVAYVTRSEVRLLEDQTISGSYTLPTQEIAGFVAIDRALTIVEKVKLIQYLASKVEGVNYGAEIDRLTLIAINAVDVFVYDTSKDSDGGAWRTGALAQASSWYNETLNTATRGSRREFPAVAVIVAEAAKVTIYDGDDPVLPMWMVFNVFSQYFLDAATTATTMLNGNLCVVGNANGLVVVDFLADAARQFHTTGIITRVDPVVLNRNTAQSSTTDFSIKLVNQFANDVAMTVLPDAPIDPATGLPVPTIAVATAGGVSVITDSGAVYDSSSTNPVNFIDFYGQRMVAQSLAYGWFRDFGDISAIVADGFGGVTYYDGGYPCFKTTFNQSDIAGFDVAQSIGLTKFAPDFTDKLKGMVAYTTSTYNTGWMNGDIKGAFLSDTDTASLVGGTDNDRSVNANPLTVNGTVTRSPVATGAELVAYSGFSTSNYLEQPYNPALDFGTGDFCIMGWSRFTNLATWQGLFARTNRQGSYAGSTDTMYARLTDQGRLGFYLWTGTATTSQTISDVVPFGVWVFWALVRRGGILQWFVNGVPSGAAVSDGTDVSNISDGTEAFLIGREYFNGGGFAAGNTSFALFRIGATAPSADQIAKIYNDEKVLFQENAACTLYGASDAVTALAHDPDTDLLHAGTSAGRSVFEGLRRVGNTTTSVSTSISASGGLIVEK